MASKRAHAASAFEFLIPLGFALLYLRAATQYLGGSEAGLILLVAALTTFAVNLDISGGRALTGKVARLTDEAASKFVRSGLVWAISAGTLVALASLAIGLLAFAMGATDAPRPEPAALLLFGISCIFAQASNHLSWCRLGLGDYSARSLSVAASGVAGITALACIQLAQTPSQWHFALPFLARDASQLCWNSLWLQRKYGVAGPLDAKGWISHLPLVGKSVGLSFTTGLFEPLLKVSLASGLGLTQLPAFELAQRAHSAARNALVTFTQSYTHILAKINVDNEYVIDLLEIVIGISAALLLSIGAVFLALFAQQFTAQPGEATLEYFIPLIPSMILQSYAVPRYLCLFIRGRIWILICIHAAQAIPVCLMILVARDHSSALLVTIASISYSVGFLTTTLLSRDLVRTRLGSLRAALPAALIAPALTCSLSWSVAHWGMWPAIIALLTLAAVFTPTLASAYRKTI